MCRMLCHLLKWYRIERLRPINRIIVMTPITERLIYHSCSNILTLVLSMFIAAWLSRDSSFALDSRILSDTAGLSSCAARFNENKKASIR